MDTAKADLYAILEVSPRTSLEVIQAAHDALLRRYGEGTSTPDNERIKEVYRAFAILSDQTQRQAYDNQLLHPDGKVINGYRFLERIAEGSFGRTYKAQHLLTGELVCIKDCSRISPQDEKVLLNEAKAMWDLRHWGIPVVRDVIRIPGGSLALVMSFIPGPTLEQIIKRVGALDPEHVAWMMERGLNILAYMHYQGTLHGDIKPQNMLIQNQTHTVCLVDFGLAMVKPTASSRAIGYTKVFSSPEQQRLGPICPESDLYSLGMTMIYALTGGDMNRVAAKEVPANTPAPLCELIRRLVLEDSKLRPRWEIENLLETIGAVREKSFARRSSGMTPIPGID